MAQINAIEEIVTKTDFSELKTQKAALLDAMNKLKDKHTVSKLEGLLSFIDSIQDMAVDIYGMDENVVFDLNEE